MKYLITTRKDEKWGIVYRLTPIRDGRPCKKCNKNARRNGSAYCGVC